MAIRIIYFIVIFLSNTVGAISGMGGGVIIKPVLDAIGYHSLTAVSFYSSAAVLTMSVSSTAKQLKDGVKVDARQAVLLSAGSVLGGISGDLLFRTLLQAWQTEVHVQLLQNILMIASLVFVLFYTLKGSVGFSLRRPIWFFAAGLFLGAFSTLLGIGGGPINVAVLMLLFSLPIKRAVTYSIITILFSQLSKLVYTGFTTGYGTFDLTVLLYIIPAALLGGYMGSKISNALSGKKVTMVYNLVVAGVIAINVFNLASLFI